jgi:hypothetical protein
MVPLMVTTDAISIPMLTTRQCLINITRWFDTDFKGQMSADIDNNLQWRYTLDSNWKPVEDDGYYMDDIDWYGDRPHLPETPKRRIRKEKSYKEFLEYLHAREMQNQKQPITYDDQIDFHQWLRDTPIDWIIQKLKEGDK